FSLARYLLGKSEDEANKAVAEVENMLELCWELLRDADRSSTKIEAPRLNLHRGTKLLIVVGQPSQVEVVEQVIGQLQGGGVPGASIPPAAYSGAPDDANTEAARRRFAERYGLRYGGGGQSPPPSSASTNPPAGSK